MNDILDSLNLKKILLIGVFFRVLSTIFSKGYAFTDDHFEVVELAQNLLDKTPNPFSSDFLVEGKAYLFSLIYPYIHYLVFGICEWFGTTNPDVKMLAMRALHAISTIPSIYYGYKITERLSSRVNDAKIVALLLACFWIMPFMSVRNVREFVCITPLLMGCYYAMDSQLSTKSVLLSAFWFTIAFVLRYQIIFIPFIVGLMWFFQKNTFQKALIFGVAFGIFYLLTQGLFDYLYWGNPIASIQAYFTFNANPKNIDIYPNGPWHRYIGTMTGLFLGFPFLLLLAGYFKTATQSHSRKILFFASLFFFAFHSYYPNKQERFVMPFVPFFIILGIIGFRDIYEQYKGEKWLRGFTKFAVIWFLILNTGLVFLLSVTYTKRSRVESMNYLREKGDMTNLVIQNYEASQPEAPFYLGKKYDFYTIDTREKMAELPNQLKLGTKVKPNYVILVGNSEIEIRKKEMKKVFPTMEHEVDIEPSFVDNLAYLMNPSHNHNETFYIFRIR
jgi:hypothetical protein